MGSKREGHKRALTTASDPPPTPRRTLRQQRRSVRIKTAGNKRIQYKCRGERGQREESGGLVIIKGGGDRKKGA